MRTPPSREALIELLRDRDDRPLGEVAALLGVPRSAVRRRASEEGVLRGTMVEWHAAARWLLDAWPPATLLAILGRHADLLPIGLHPLPLVVTPPAFVVHALRVQWRFGAMPHRMVRPATFEEYVADVLHGAIEPSTVRLLRHDADFMRAYDFPQGDPDG